jgi:3-phenylpropionate/trans-cinnamate dioxygenase ferredoxin reductase subunit
MPVIRADPPAGQVVHRGEPASARFSAWWLRGNTVVAAFVMNRPDEEREFAPQWIESARRVPAAALADASRPLAASAV